MSYEYANARIRALRGTILRGRELEALAALPGVAELVAALGRTDLAADIEAIGHHGPPSVRTVDEAVRRNLRRRLRDVARFFEDGSEPRRLVGIVLLRYDLDNTVTVLRGKAAGAAPAEIATALLPAGVLDDDRLMALTEAADLAAVAQLVGAWALPFAPALVEELARVREHGRMAGIEAALRRRFDAWVRSSVRPHDANAALVLEWASLEAHAMRAGVAARLAAHAVPPTAEAFAGPIPTTPHRALARAIAAADPAPDLPGAVRVERAADGYRARWARAQLLRDPLGIAVAICYVAEKEQEARALRLVARRRGYAS